MSVTFVKAFLDLNTLEKNRPGDKNTSFYIQKGIELLSYPYSFIVFIDNDSYKLLPENVRSCETITFYTVEIETLPVYYLLDPNLTLPSGRNMKKDTYHYLCVNISKTSLIEKAIEYNPYESTHFAWIDFGILHIIKDNEKDQIKDALYNISNYRENRIRIPGCIDPKNGVPNLLSFKDFPLWVFCGGFFCGEKNELKKFSADVLDVLRKMDFMTWEVNIWASICTDKFDWYKADHNLSMLTNF